MKKKYGKIRMFDFCAKNSIFLRREEKKCLKIKRCNFTNQNCVVYKAKEEQLKIE